MNVDLTNLKPYGDALNDGKIQLSFTFPIDNCSKAEEAAKEYVEKLGFSDVEVVFSKDLGKGFAFFVVYGKAQPSINYNNVTVSEVDTEFMNYYDINSYIKENIKRKLIVVGACTGSDAHTVGIDAIMNMKGYNHDYGLERYPEIEAHNLGAQVTNEQIIKKAMELSADAILVSQIVTQKDVHIHNLTEFVELAESYGIRDKMVIICGGPRLNNKLAVELGFDAGFGRNTLPSHVASYIVKKIHEE